MFKFFLFLLLNTLCFANCSSSFLNISEIEMNIGNINGKKYSYGILIKNQHQFKKFLQNLKSNEDIIYIVNKDLEIMVSPRIVAEKNDNNVLVAHISLFTKMKNENLNTQIIASGEIRRNHGHISVLNNKSGTFKGTSQHLDLTEKLFKSIGLPDYKYKKIDYSSKSVPNDHIDDIMISENYIEISQSKQKSEIHQKIKQYLSKLYERIPSSETIGYIDTSIILDLFLKPDTSIDLISPLGNAIAYIKYLQEESLYFYSSYERLIDIEKSLQTTLKHIQ